MRRLMLLLPILLTLPLAAHAQGYNLYGGYSFIHLDSSPNTANLNGWDFAFTDNFIPAVGITADVSGTYGSTNGISGTSFHSFLFGPQLRFPGPVSPFVRGLVGFAHGVGPGTGGTSVSEGFGGGIDIHLISIVSFRPVQFDYIRSHIAGYGQNNYRYSIGLVFHL